MTDKSSSILLVEDMESLSRVYVEYLRRLPCTVRTAATAAAGLGALDGRLPDVLLLDLGLPDGNGMDILRHVTVQQLPVAVIVITAQGSINTAVEAMKAGAFDFLVKPFSADRLVVTVRNAIERQRLNHAVETLKEELGRDRYGGFIGASLPMQAVYRIIDSAAPSKATVFITGESGTGKELCAEAIHQRSPRRAKPFVALNCGAIPKDLVESEVFGHVKGAFTGASADREGAASRAAGGTLFLDEICEMELPLQTKLLRFLQTGQFQKVGGSRVETADARIVCATNRHPLEEVAAGRFREDLYYRLHVIPIELPPLRERDEDVIAIARAFLRKFGAEERKRFTGFAPEAEAMLQAYPWPGNVRQLQNVVRNIVVLHDGAVVDVAMVPVPVSGAGSPTSRPSVRGGAEPTFQAIQASEVPVRPLWQTERQAIEEAIHLCNGNVPKAAALLEVSPSTLYRKRQAWLGSDDVQGT